MKKYLFLKPVQFVLCAACGALYSLLGLGMGFVDGAFVNLAMDGSLDQLARVFLLSMVWLMSYLAAGGIYGFLNNKYLRDIKSRLRQDLFEKIMDQGVPEFNAKNSSTYIADLNTNIQNLTDCYFDQVFLCVYYAASFIGSFAGLLWLDPSNIIIIVVLTAISFLVPTLAGKYVEKRSTQYLGGLDEYTAHLKDYLSGFMVIRTFSLHERIMKKHRVYNEDLENKKMAQSNLDILLQLVGMLIGIFSTMVTLAYGVWLILQGRVHGGDIIAMGHLIGQVTGIITTIIGVSSQFHAAKPIIDRFNGILNRQSAPRDQGETLEDVREIAFDGVTLRLHGGQDRPGPYDRPLREGEVLRHRGRERLRQDHHLQPAAALL